MELPPRMEAAASSAAQPDIGWVGAVALAVVFLDTATLAAGGGYVFFASIRPVSIPTGYFSPFIDFPWIAAAAPILAACVLGPAVLLIVGSAQVLLHNAGRRWRSAVAWLGTLAAATVLGYLVLHDYELLLTAYPKDLDGSPLGPSRWAPGGPYWQALAEAFGELAVGVAMAAVVTAPCRLGAVGAGDRLAVDVAGERIPGPE